MKQTHAFTLIELIVGVTLSLVLMVSVGVFINNGMHMLFSQQKALENTDNFTLFTDDIFGSLELLSGDTGEPNLTGSGIIFQRGTRLGDGGFSYIGSYETPVKNNNGIYCLSGSEDILTKHIFHKAFIPFEEIGEDIFSDFNATLTSTIVSSNTYVSDYKNHIVTKDGIPIIGKGIFGSQMKEGAIGTGIYLHSPTGMALIGNNLFVSDTLNNRILHYDTSNDTVDTLLDENDGLSEPTGLAYAGGVLYIANSGKGEILEYSSKSISSPQNLIFSGVTVNNVNQMEIRFFHSGTPHTITGPTYKGEITFSNISKGDDFLGIDDNTLQYYFVNYSSSESNQPECSGNEERLVGGNPVRCVSTGTGKTSTYQNKNIHSSETITINNILSDLSATGSYYVDLHFLNTGSGVFSESFPFVVNGDSNILTKNDNTLKVMVSGLKYPTGIRYSGGQIQVNEFGERKQKTFDTNGNLISSNNISGFDSLPYSKDYDNILKTPIKELTLDYSNKLLTLILKYYSRYNCYDLNDTVERSFILKKNVK